jgi:hypothetical protein
VREWREESTAMNNYLEEIVKINTIICENDLPEFYDPIEY